MAETIAQVFQITYLILKTTTSKALALVSTKMSKT